MKRIGLLVLFLIGVTACQAQDKDKTMAQRQEEPKGKWQVHREYDENGNLVKYDSVYVWSSSNIKGFPKNQNLDSLLKSYKRYMGKSGFSPEQFDFSLFENPDSLFNKNFFDNEFFFDNWIESDGKRIRQMMRRMDSLRMRFLQERFPDKAIIEDKRI